MSAQQKEMIGVWIYRAIIGAVVISMWTKIDRAVDLTIIHENEIKNIKESQKDLRSDMRTSHSELWMEVAKIKENQFKIQSKQ